jgi:hypothetical protein
MGRRGTRSDRSKSEEKQSNISTSRPWFTALLGIVAVAAPPAIGAAFIAFTQEATPSSPPAAAAPQAMAKAAQVKVNVPSIAACLANTSMHAPPCTQTARLLRIQLPLPNALFFAAEDLDLTLFEDALAKVGTSPRDGAGRSAVARMAAVSGSLITKLAKFLLYADGLVGRRDHDFGFLFDQWPPLPAGLRAWHRAHGDAPFYGRAGVNDITSALAPAHLEIAAAFVRAGGDIDAPDNDGLTALHHAAHNGLADLVSGLLALGASPNAHDVFGRTPLELATRRRRDATIAVLSSVTHEARAMWGAEDVAAAPAPSPTLEGPFRMRLHAARAEGATGGWRRGLDPASVAILEAHGDECVHVKASEIDAVSFFEKHVALSVPVIVSGAAEDWDLHSLGREAMLRVKSSHRVPLGRVPYPNTVDVDGGRHAMTLAEYVASHMGGRHGDGQSAASAAPAPLAQEPPLYFFQQMTPGTLEQEYPELHRAVRIPSWLAGDASFGQTSWQIIVGPTGSGAPEHFHFDAVNTLAFGTKQWFLVPPDAAGFSKVHPAIAMSREPPSGLYTGPSTLHCIQHAGDAIYIPRGYGHAVLNHGDTVSLAAEFWDLSKGKPPRIAGAEARGYGPPPWSLQTPLIRSTGS